MVEADVGEGPGYSIASNGSRQTHQACFAGDRWLRGRGGAQMRANGFGQESAIIDFAPRGETRRSDSGGGAPSSGWPTTVQIDFSRAWPSESHPEPLTEPGVNVSVYPARATELKASALSAKTRDSSGFPLTRSRRRCPPSLHAHYTASTLTRNTLAARHPASRIWSSPRGRR
jgi:hypothetical protein